MAFIILFLGSLLLGQLGGIPFAPGIVVYVHDIFLVLLLLFSIRNFRSSKLLKPIILFFGAALLSLLFALFRFPFLDIVFGSLYLVRWVMYAMLCFIVYKNKDVWLKGLYVVGVAFGVLGLMQFFLYPDLRNLMYLGWDPHYYRLFSTLLDPNFMGILLVLTLLLGLGIGTKRNRIWIIVGEIIAFIALLLTYSRSSFLAFGAAIVIWSIMRKQWKWLVALAAFSVLILFLPKTPGSTLSLFRVDSTLARIGNWQDSIEFIKISPVFGLGFDTLRYVHGDTVSKAAGGVDSSLLFVAVTTGIVGLAAYGYLLVSMIRAGRASVYYVASITALLVHSLFVNSLFYPWVVIWVWILSAVVICDT